MDRTVKILSIDGGGMRGIIPATILDRIEKITHKPIAHLFDLIAGTSTGGILALGLTKPDATGHPQYSASDLAQFYISEGAHVFARSILYRLFAMNNLSLKKFPAAGVEAVLERYFGDARLSDAVTDVLIPSYEIEQGFPFFFKSSAARQMPDHDFPMRKVARAASAAPTYFVPFRLMNYALVDGGVYANNPAACAYAEARTAFPRASNLMLVSLGTGRMSKGISYHRAKHWGVAKWAKPILDVVFDGVNSTVDYQMRQILSPSPDGVPNYYRFQTTLNPSHTRVDDFRSANITALQGVAEKLVDQHAELILQLCRTLERIGRKESLVTL